MSFEALRLFASVQDLEPQGQELGLCRASKGRHRKQSENPGIEAGRLGTLPDPVSSQPLQHPEPSSRPEPPGTCPGLFCGGFRNLRDSETRMSYTSNFVVGLRTAEHLAQDLRRASC